MSEVLEIRTHVEYEDTSSSGDEDTGSSGGEEFGSPPNGIERATEGIREGMFL